jgi:hypothetical protein
MRHQSITDASEMVPMQIIHEASAKNVALEPFSSGQSWSMNLLITVRKQKKKKKKKKKQQMVIDLTRRRRRRRRSRW